jgi:hypothetical protein
LHQVSGQQTSFTGRRCRIAGARMNLDTDSGSLFLAETLRPQRSYDPR